MAEEEMNRLKLVIQAAEVDKQMLRQNVQNLTVDEFLNRLKLDLSCEQIGWKG